MKKNQHFKTKSLPKKLFNEDMILKKNIKLI